VGFLYDEFVSLIERTPRELGVGDYSFKLYLQEANKYQYIQVYCHKRNVSGMGKTASEVILDFRKNEGKVCPQCHK
jgi:hypothetical protein